MTIIATSAYVHFDIILKTYIALINLAKSKTTGRLKPSLAWGHVRTGVLNCGVEGFPTVKLRPADIALVRPICSDDC